eukprot:SAG22_NODE_9654_length_576_cov_3.375262_1_plen_55_part_10
MEGAQLQGEISFAQLAGGAAANPSMPSTPQRSHRQTTRFAPNTAPPAVRGGGVGG